MTGTPAETLSGETGKADYEAALSAQVVGQAEPVRAVATELRLINELNTDPNAVFLLDEAENPDSHKKGDTLRAW